MFIFYGLVMLGLIAIAFVVYALIFTGSCPCCMHLSLPQHTNTATEKQSPPKNLTLYAASTFIFKEGLQNATSQTECVVCLTVFEEESYVRQLPNCRHSFHAPCIDMWLQYHSDCPLCRAPVARLDSDTGVLRAPENSILDP